jgi:phenylpyruvate tautomerase PptA (4-oxalocrotonate tautomerase family)
MPLYNIYHPVGAYTAADKAEFAKRIVDTYKNVIPRFYVVVLFSEITKDDFFIGGVAHDKFVRIRCDHFARHQVGPTRNSHFEPDQWMDSFEKSIAPFVGDRGYDWEVHYGQTAREMWRVQGMKPPEARSEEENLWIKENRAVPF